MVLKRTYKYRLYPTKNQVSKLEDTIDTCRILYNSTLLDRINRYKNTKESLTYNEQATILKNDKDKYDCLNTVYSQVLQDVLRRVDKAFKTFYRRLKNKDKKVGFPRFKGEGRLHSFTYPQSGFKVEDSKLYLSKIGYVKLKQHRVLEGKIKTGIITKELDRWYVCIVVEIDKDIKKKTVNKAVGIDVGIKNFATFSDGTIIDNPKYLLKSENKLKTLQRRLSKKKKGSNNRKKTKYKLARQHRKVKNQRLDFHHKVSRQLVNTYDLIAFEDLQIKNMVKNHNLAKLIHDAGWNQFIGFIIYKAEEAGIYGIPINPYNTSIECSNCGNPVKKDLSIRIHRCNHCGLELDRDINASINILNRAGTARIKALGDVRYPTNSMNGEVINVN